MTYDEITLLTDLLFILEDSEGEVLNSVDKVFKKHSVLQNEYYMKVKGVIPLQFSRYDWWTGRTFLTKFRPVIEINYGDEIFSLVFNRQATTLVYDVNSKLAVGSDSKGERYYENLLLYNDTKGHVMAHRANEEPTLQRNLLSTFLQAVFLDKG